MGLVNGARQNGEADILVVLEKGAVEDAYGIRVLLEKWFGLKPSLNALRKNLHMCYEQGLVTPDKLVGGSYRYRISEKGRKRLSLIRDKRSKEFEGRLDDLLESRESERLLRTQEKRKREWLIERIVEVESSLRLCNAVLNGFGDEHLMGLARNARCIGNL